VQAWTNFTNAVTQPQAPCLKVEQHAGAESVGLAYQHVLAGRGDPRVGHMLSL
jgi:hypothetical protein